VKIVVMRMLRSWGYLIILLGSSFSLWADEARNPQMCESMVGVRHSVITVQLKKIENAFQKMGWAYWRHREVVYRPLWEALKKKEDPFSKKFQAEGEVLAMRYSHLAGLYESEAEAYFRTLIDAMDLIEGNLVQISNSCASEPFQDCFRPWQDDLRTPLKEIKELVLGFQQDQERLSREVTQTLDESMSEHHDFADRYQEQEVRWHSEVYPVFIRALRIAEEELSFHWKGESCCAQCREDFIRKQQDPVLQQIKGNLAASHGGVEGSKALPKEPLMDAFEALEAEKLEWEH